MAKGDEIGALWVKQGQSGEFMSGEITVGGVKQAVTIFRNTFKKPGERTPDWRIFPKRDQQASPATDDDIPFG